ncbi:MAG: CBS domain-containing protein [Deltaproteobacteria bacterium]|nr:CBS domain-containing protein [Deltaproteobacteria bacterium]
MSLQNLLTKKLISCSPSSSIQMAAGLMEKENVGAVVIVGERDGGPVGIVTDRDIAIRCVARGMDANQNVSEVMTTEVETVSDDEGIYDIIHTMKRSEVRRVPVVDKAGKCIGLLSFGDVFELLGRELSDLLPVTAPEKPKLVKQSVETRFKAEAHG